MARIENKPKVFLTQEEVEILRKAQKIINELWDTDTNNGNSEIFCQIDNFETDWSWIDTALENLIDISEVE